VVWSEYNGNVRNVRMVRSDDNGMTFGSVGNGFAVSGNVDMTQPRLAAAREGEVFLTFIGTDSQGERGVLFTWTRTGGTFRLPNQLASSRTGGLRDPVVVARGEGDSAPLVMVLWQDGTATGGNVLAWASPNGGERFPGEPVDLSAGNTQPAGNRRPVAALGDGVLVCCWEGQPPGGGVQRVWSSNSPYVAP
jgi:hypothetical protein